MLFSLSPPFRFYSSFCRSCLMNNRYLFGDVPVHSSWCSEAVCTRYHSNVNSEVLTDFSTLIHKFNYFAHAERYMYIYIYRVQREAERDNKTTKFKLNRNTKNEDEGTSSHTVR